MDCKNESNRLNSKAHQIPSTLNPKISWSANNMMTALMINKNKPKVKMVTGSVSMTKIGFTKKLSKLSTMATIIAVR